MKMNRVFLKLSGEALAGPKKTGFDEDTVKSEAGISGEAAPVRLLTVQKRIRSACWLRL